MYKYVQLFNNDNKANLKYSSESNKPKDVNGIGWCEPTASETTGSLFESTA